MTNVLRAAGAAALAAALAGGRVAAAQPPGDTRALTPDERRRVDSVLARVGGAAEPGCALVVVRDGRPVYRGARGVASLATRAPITAATPFYVGSVSKAFVAMAALRLAREGRLSLDADARRYLPALPPAVTGGRPLTVRHLVAHTGGLRDYEALRELGGRDLRERFGAGDVLRLVRRQRGGDFAPGAEHAYTNTGYFLLARAVEQAAGRPIAAYAAARVFAPLGMRASAFRDRPGAPPGMAVGYAAHPDSGFVVAEPAHTLVGAGGLVTTAEDLGRWLAAFDTTPGGAPLGLGELLVPQGMADGSPGLYTAGLFALAVGQRPVLEHYGAYLGFEAFVVRDPLDRVGVAVTCNRQGAAPHALAHGALRAVVGAAVGGAPSYRPRGLVAPTPAAWAAPAPAGRRAAMHGTYWSARTGEVWTLASDSAGRLVVRGTGQAPTPLAADGPPSGRFVSEEGAMEVVGVPAAAAGDASGDAPPAAALRVRRAWRPTVAPDAFVRVEPTRPELAPRAPTGAYASAEADATVRLVRDGAGYGVVDGRGRRRAVTAVADTPSGAVLVAGDDWVLAVGADTLRLSTGALRNVTFTRLRAAR